MDHVVIHLIRERNFRKIAEIGVFGGNLTGQVFQKTDGVEVYYCVDPWHVYAEESDRPLSAAEKSQEYWEALYNKVNNRFKNNDKVKIIRMTSVDAANYLKSKSELLDIIYIDAIHNGRNICLDLINWIPLVRKGGVVTGHDYIKRFKEMADALDYIFEDDLNVLVNDKSLPRLTHGNALQGGNWWVEVEDNKKEKWIQKAKERYSTYSNQKLYQEI